MNWRYTDVKRSRQGPVASLRNWALPQGAPMAEVDPEAHQEQLLDLSHSHGPPLMGASVGVCLYSPLAFPSSAGYNFCHLIEDSIWQFVVYHGLSAIL